MRVFTTIIIFLISTLLLSFAKNTNPVTITGHVKFRDTSINIRTMLIVVRGNNKVLARAYTNANGDFNITFTPKNERLFKFYCSGPAIGTELIGTVKTFESDTPEMTFYVPRRSNTK